ncbi:MAG: alpha/beta hydrolase [Phycisphaerales bacterium]
MTGLLILLAIGAAIFWATMVAHVAWMLAHPPRRTYASAVARGRPGEPSELDPPRAFQSWTFRSRGFEFPVWDIAGDDPAGPIVILTHGWADSRIGGLVRVNAIAPHASRVILWDLPGHGEAPGVCRLGTAEVKDLRALMDVVGEKRRDEETQRRSDQSPERERRVGAPAPLVLYGWSLGAGVSIVVARDDARIAAVIAESPYRLPATPARNVLRARALPHRLTLPPALWLLGMLFRVGPQFRPRQENAESAEGAKGRGEEQELRDSIPGREPEPGFPRDSAPSAPSAFSLPFDRAAHAGALPCPLLVLHGTDDEVCPIEDGRAIAAAAPAGRIVEVAGGRHNDLWTEPANTERCEKAVVELLTNRDYR